MSLFSGDCQELSPCAVPVQHPSQTNYGTNTATTSTTALGNPKQLQPQSRKSSIASTAIDIGCAEGGAVHKSQERKETDGTCNVEGGNAECANGSKNHNTQGEDDASKITRAPSSVTR